MKSDDLKQAIKALEDLMDVASDVAFGMTRSEALKNHVCVRCHKAIDGFNTEKEAEEYQSTAFCSNCQEEMYSDPLLAAARQGDLSMPDILALREGEELFLDEDD